MSKRPLTRTILVWFLILIITLTGCGSLKPNSSSPQKTSEKTNQKTDQNAEFEAFTEELFQNEVQANTLNLHYTLSDPSSYGIKDYPITLGSFSEKSRSASAAAIENCLNTLKGFDPEKLTLKNQLTHDILTDYFKMEKDGADYYLYEEPLSPIIGTQAQLPVLFAEYTFRSKEDVDTYLSLLSQIRNYYGEIIKFEQAKSAAGLFMADYAVNDIVEQCREFMKNPDKNYLLETFNERLSKVKGLSSAQIKAYEKKNKQIFKSDVIPAYQLLIDGLTKLKGTGKNERGLSYLKQGKEYYEYLVKSSTGTSKSVDEVKKRLNTQMKTDMSTMNRLLAKDPTLVEKLDSDNLSLDDPEAILEDLQKKIKEDFPTPPDTRCEIKYVPKALEEHLSPAFYMVSPIDDSSRQVIYINRGNDYDKVELYTTLAHEGYPGHLYQTICTNAASLNNVRNLLNFSGYVEGWATYVEMYSYGISGLEKDLADLLQVNNSIILNIYSQIDVGVNYDGWSFKDTCEFLMKYGIEDRDTARNIYKIIVEEPANYLKYYVGYLEFLDLRDEAENDLGDRFLLKNFHAFVLQTGPAPFEVLKKYMKLIL